MSEIITERHAEVAQFLQTIEALESKINTLSKSHKTLFNGESYTTDKELSERLHICRRTLQEWRNNGQIAYIKLDGKIIYPESAIQALLDRHYTKAWSSEY